MFKNLTMTITLLCLAALTACGGGSSGGGGQLAGNYVGTINYSFAGAGGSFADSAPAVVVVTGAGEIGFASLEGGASSCSGVPPIFLEGNSFNSPYNTTVVSLDSEYVQSVRTDPGPSGATAHSRKQMAPLPVPVVRYLLSRNSLARGSWPPPYRANRHATGLPTP